MEQDGETERGSNSRWPFGVKNSFAKMKCLKNKKFNGFAKRARFGFGFELIGNTFIMHWRLQIKYITDTTMDKQ